MFVLHKEMFFTTIPAVFDQINNLFSILLIITIYNLIFHEYNIGKYSSRYIKTQFNHS